MSTRAGILEISAVLEATGVGAYDGAAFEIQNKAYLVVAGQIVQVEARHTAAIREIDERTADNPVPLAFEQTLRPQQVLDAVNRLMSSN